MGKSLKRWVWRLTLVLAGAVLLYQLWILGHIVYWNFYNPSSSAFMQERLDVMQEKKPEAVLLYQWVPYEKISPHLKRAIIAAEDGKFLQHEGFDFEAIQKAYEKNIEKGSLSGWFNYQPTACEEPLPLWKKNAVAQDRGGNYYADAGECNVQAPHLGNLLE